MIRRNLHIEDPNRSRCNSELVGSFTVFGTAMTTMKNTNSPIKKTLDLKRQEGTSNAQFLKKGWRLLAA